MSENKDSPHFYILGGGVCGLFAALEAQKKEARVTVLEKEKQAGGLAAGHLRKDNWYDLGVHMLHAFDQEVYDACSDAMGQERIEVPLKAQIKWLGKQYQYPLRGRDILRGLPPMELVSCITGLLIADIQGRLKMVTQVDDAESALKELYGIPLYKFFFEEFTHRYWGMHPSELSAEFVRRKMPRLSAVDVIKNFLSWLKIPSPNDSVEGALRFETLHYSKSGAEALPRCLSEKIRKQGGNLITGAPVSAVIHKHGVIQEVKMGDVQVGTAEDHYLSTIPITELILSLSPPPPQEVLIAARSLHYKPMVVYALLVKKERCMDALYTYYRDQIFHRVGEPKNAGLKVTPEGHTTLIVEMTCEVGDEKWGDGCFPDILQGLEAEGLCYREDVIEKHLIRSRYAYPIFKKGYEEHLQVIASYLAQFSNLKSVGRQGAFCYPNMHQAMKMGANGINELLQNRP